MNSEADLATAIRGRIAELIGDEQPFAWAKRVGIPSATFDRMWNGNTVLGAKHLLQISKDCGVTVDWLLTGWTPPPHWEEDDETYLARLDQARAAQQAAKAEIDPVLYGRVTEAVAAVYTELGYTVVLHQVAAEAARIAIELTGMEFTEEERPVVIKGAMAALRSRLRESLSHPEGEAAGKRPA